MRRLGADPTPILNPAAFARSVGRVHVATPEVVDDAVAAAAAVSAAWAATGVDERIALLSSLDADLAAGLSSWPQLLTQEQGKVLSESSMEVFVSQQMIKLYSSLAPDALADRETEDERGRLLEVRDPVGVVAALTPWNWPVVLSLTKVIPALLAGNTVVLKPAPNTPLVITEFMAKIAAALPPGVVNVVQGGADVGAALVGHPRVRKVSFTGSVASGQSVYATASATVKDLTLELGGNDAAVVLDDVDLAPGTIASMLQAMFSTTGQICMAIKRVYIHESVFDALLEALIAGAQHLVVGDGLAPDTTMGPLNNKAQYDRIVDLRDEASALGGRVIEVGSRSATAAWDGGYFVQPCFVTSVDEKARLVCEEQFGPVVPLIAVRDADEAIRRANATEYGLCGSVWSADIRRAFDVARRLETGVTWVNEHGVSALDLTLGAGGVKQSGLGLEGGIPGLQSFTHPRYITNRSAF
jgi:aldehyde dehydrogenase